MEDEGQRPPAGVTGERRTPPIPVRAPAKRHSVSKFRASDRGRRGDRNTLIEPWVDVQADIDAINHGEGIVDAGLARVWVNGRLWGYHADTGTGTLWPIEGVGFVQMNQKQYRALTIVARYNGLTEDAERQLAHMDILTEDDRDLVRRIWRMREEARNP